MRAIRWSVLFLPLLAAPAAAQEPGGKAGPPRYADALAHKPTPIPDRIILTWKGDPTTTQAVTWRTDASVPKALAQIAVSEPGPGFAPIGAKGGPAADKVRDVPAVTTPLKTDLNEAHYHSAHFEGLKPKTKYVYRVGDGANWSEWFQFETAADWNEPFSFLYFGDAQNDIKQHWSRVVRGAYSDMPKAKFIIHAGDLINRGPSDSEWGEWFNAAGWINGMVPSVPTPGNHEYSGQPAENAAEKGGEKAAGGDRKGADAQRRSRLTAHWRPQFTLPENGPAGLEETAYYFDYQGVRVVSLNSNEKQEDQAVWLEKVLQNNPNKWTVLTFHHPIYSTARGRDNKKLRELWRPVFDKFAPDLVLQGHDHTYGRSGLMREDNLLTGALARGTRGTVYVVSVSGPKMYQLEESPWMKSKAQDTQLYQIVRVDGDRLHYESRTATGDLYDVFELRKRADGRNDLVERPQLQRETAAVDGSEGDGNALAAIGAVVACVLALFVWRLIHG